MTKSKYLSLAERIAININSQMLSMGYLPVKEWKKLYHIFQYDPDGAFSFGDNVAANEHRIIALLLMHEFYLDELKKKKK